MTRATVTKGSGNVFRDLGFSEEKSAELILKSSLLQALQETIKGREWKQVEAATQLGIDQAKVSKLLAGQSGRKCRDPHLVPSCFSSTAGHSSGDGEWMTWDHAYIGGSSGPAHSPM